MRLRIESDRRGKIPEELNKIESERERERERERENSSDRVESREIEGSKFPGLGDKRS
jgi:hypothetical protein